MLLISLCEIPPHDQLLREEQTAKVVAEKQALENPQIF